MVYEATHLRDRRWAVRPKGRLGTCGWIGDVAWTVVYVTADDARQALARAAKRRARPDWGGGL